MIKFKEKGNFRKFNRFSERFKNLFGFGELDKYGRDGVLALQKATPIDTGETADSWSYKIVNTEQGTKLIFENSNIQNGALVAILIQYGHATRSGVYIEGIDYINPAIAPIFLEICTNIEKEVG